MNLFRSLPAIALALALALGAATVCADTSLPPTKTPDTFGHATAPLAGTERLWCEQLGNDGKYHSKYCGPLDVFNLSLSAPPSPVINLSLPTNTTSNFPQGLRITQTSDTDATAFGTPLAQLSSHGRQNTLVASAINDRPANDVSFPTGVTGYCKMVNGGNQCFGGFFRSDQYSTGNANGMEINVFNFAGAPTNNVPPNQAFGTTEISPVVLKVNPGGNYPAYAGIMIGSTGNVSPGQLYGIMMKAGKVTDTGLYIDANNTSASSPTKSIFAANYGNGTNLVMKTTGPMQANNAMLTALKSDGTVQASIKQNGGIFGLGGGYFGGSRPGNAPTYEPTGATMLHVSGQGVLQAFGAGSAPAPTFYFTSSRGAQDDKTVAVQQSDKTLDIIAQATDGTNYVASAEIVAGVDAAVSTGIVPGNIRFRVAANGTGVMTDAVRIASDRSVTLGQNGGSTTRVTAAAPAADQAYDYQTPATGFSYTFANTTSGVILDPAGTLATGTIVLPSAPTDGQQLFVSTSATITALTVTPGSGQIDKCSPSTMAARNAFRCIYRSANTSWYPR